MSEIRANGGAFFVKREERPDYERRPLWLRYLIGFVMALAMTGCAYHSEALQL